MPRFVKYGINVMGVSPNLPLEVIANRAIDATYDFFKSIGIPMHLREVGIDESRIDEMAHHIPSTKVSKTPTLRSTRTTSGRF